MWWILPERRSENVMFLLTLSVYLGQSQWRIRGGGGGGGGGQQARAPSEF